MRDTEADDIIDSMDFGSNIEVIICCPMCLGGNLIKNGNRQRKTKKIGQLQCKDCGKFFLEEYLYPGADPSLTDEVIINAYRKYKSYNQTSKMLVIARSTLKKRMQWIGIDPYQTGERGCEVEYEWGPNGVKYKNPWELEGSDAYYHQGYNG